MPCPHGNTCCEENEADANGWKKGPFPEGTWLWGAVCLYGEEGKPQTGFYFADFHGDHAILQTEDKRKVYPHEVAYYNNSIGLVPKA